MSKKWLSTVAPSVIAALIPVFAFCPSAAAADTIAPASASSPGPQDAAATATPIKHLIIIFNENVSFDHYFATYPKGTNPPGEPAFAGKPDTPKVNNLANANLLTNNPNFTNKANGGDAAEPFRLDRSQAFTADQNHAYTAEQQAYDGGCTAGLAGPAAHPVPADTGENPHPIVLQRPTSGPLSAMAELGRLIFFDASLSSSGKLACASCHSPQHAYGPPGDLPVMLGGPDLSRPGARAVPSLMYLERQPSFAIGPDNEENENVSIAQLVALSRDAVRVQKTAPQENQSATNMVPQGGLFWDDRADTLQDQARSPLLDPREMDGGSIDVVAGNLRRSAYAGRLTQLFGSSLWSDSRLVVSEALFAVARYQIEDVSFHPYTSKFDYWLEGKARLSESEARGYALFNDPAKANCAGCHADQPSRDGLPSLFTDHQFEALGAPRNAALAVNAGAQFFDLGICGPYRHDMAADAQYCGLFMTPTLRNVATRHVFFHNAVFTSLKQVLDFYDFRDTAPQRIYPRGADGTVEKFNDLPLVYRGNIDFTDPPFDRKAGDAPAMTDKDEDDIIAFLNTLVDGCRVK